MKSKILTKKEGLPDRGLMIHEDGDLVILRTGPIYDRTRKFPGFVVAAPTSDRDNQIGNHSSDWDGSQFVPFPGTVTLEN